jgi:hypothetical protein
MPGETTILRIPQELGVDFHIEMETVARDWLRPVLTFQMLLKRGFSSIFQ